MTEENYYFFSKRYYTALKDVFIFELRSLLGRLLFQKYPPKQKGKQLLNFGSSNNIFKGWVNADFFRLPLYTPVTGKAPNWELDLRYPLQCRSDYWDGVFCEHVLEHAYPLEVKKLCSEIYRTLKPGCWFRISVPDLKKYVDYYEGRESERKFSNRWKISGQSLWSLTQNWGHRSVWDYEMLEDILTNTGFVKVREVDFKKGTDKSIVKDMAKRKWESLYIEAQKPK